MVFDLFFLLRNSAHALYSYILLAITIIITIIIVVIAIVIVIFNVCDYSISPYNSEKFTIIQNVIFFSPKSAV